MTPRPDSGRGLFETMLVVNGRPVELDAHLARLDASLGALGASKPPPGVVELVLAAAGGLRLGRLRLDVAPGRDGAPRATVAAAALDPAAVFPAEDRAVRLRSVEVEGGLGEHKWIDRSLLERAETGTAAGETPLLHDRDRTVLEASRANLFAVRDGEIWTPPADGRILPGIARARTIEIARDHSLGLREAPLTLASLLACEAAFLTGSVRGIEPVEAVDGVALPAASRLTRLLAGALRRRWLPATPESRSQARPSARRPDLPVR